MEVCGHTKSDWRRGGIQRRVKSSWGHALRHERWRILIHPRKHSHSCMPSCAALFQTYTHAHADHASSCSLLSQHTAGARWNGTEPVWAVKLGDVPFLEQLFYCFKYVCSFGGCFGIFFFGIKLLAKYFGFHTAYDFIRFTKRLSNVYSWNLCNIFANRMNNLLVHLVKAALWKREVTLHPFPGINIW